MTSWEIALLIMLIYLCVYALVNRICKCVEMCHTSDAFREYTKQTEKKTTDLT